MGALRSFAVCAAQDDEAAVSRFRAMRFSVLIGLLLVVLPASAEDPPAARVTQEGRSPAWQTDWKTAFKMAKEDHRLVFVHYCAFSCTACRIMDEVFFSRPDVQTRLADFVLLREDFDHFNAPHGVASFPTYVVYDSGERERFRISGLNPSAEVLQPSPSIKDPGPPARLGTEFFQRMCGSTINVDVISGWLDGVRALAPTFVSVADLIDQGHELEADFMLGNLYERKGQARHAREMYDLARAVAEKNGDKARAQMAEAKSAFTYARENDPSRAIKLLRKLTSNPVDPKTEAFVWLELGRAYTLARDAKSARDAYQRALTVAVPDSAVYREASAAIARLQ
jgi:tetratricopeptide (TPR) repeat protein